MRKSDEIMQEHNDLLRKKRNMIAAATMAVSEVIDPELKRLMRDFLTARSLEIVNAALEGTPPNENSKPIDKSGCAK